MNLSREQRNHEIISNLKAILHRRGLSQRDFANLLGKKESEISRWFSGKFGVSLRTQARIEEALQEPISSDSTFRSGNGTTTADSTRTIAIGIIGTGNIAERFASESSHVATCRLAAAYDTDSGRLQKFCAEHSIEAVCTSICDLMDSCDAVYIASPVETHYEYARICLLAGKHVLCEMPFTRTAQEAKELYSLARAPKLTLMPALKTAYCPSFKQLTEIAASGIIGSISDISATVTTLLPGDTPTAYYNERLLENATYPLLAIFKLLGTGYRRISIFNQRNGEKIGLSYIYMEYQNCISSFKAGVGVKSEGSLVISGTEGYIYVPAPWWKTEYFEVRFENQNDNKKFFFPYEASGLRYEIQAFSEAITGSRSAREDITPEENLKIIEIQNKIIHKQ